MCHISLCISAYIVRRIENKDAKFALCKFSIFKLLSYQPRVTVASCAVYKVIRDLQCISDRPLVYKSYPVDRINTYVIYRFALTQWNEQVNVLLNNCKQNVMSLLVGTTALYMYTVARAVCGRKSRRQVFSRQGQLYTTCLRIQIKYFMKSETHRQHC